MSLLMKVEEFVAVVILHIISIISKFFSIFKYKKIKEENENKNQYKIIKDNTVMNNSGEVEAQGNRDTNTQNTISESSLNCLKELNSTKVISNPKKGSTVIPLNQICIVNNDNNNTDNELFSVNYDDDSKEHLIVESDVITHESMLPDNNSTPLTVNNLSKEKNVRVVHYWYNDNKKKNTYQKCICDKLRISKSDIPCLNKLNPEKRIPILDKTIESSKIKRSSLVNYTPTNIDINNIPNLNVTTTANTILNSTSNYRNDKKGNSLSRLGKEIIIRDLNSKDGATYSFNIDNLKMDSSVENNSIDDSSKELSSEEESHNGNNVEKEENETSNKTVTINAPPPSKKSSRKFSHRRQNSVRLEISY